MATSNMQQNQAMQLIAPDIAQEQQQLSRRQQLADMLRKQSLESSGPTEMVGGWAVKKSPYEGLVKMAQALAANYVQDKTDTRQLELAKGLQDRLGSVASGGGASLSSDAAATAALSTNANGPTNENAATQTQLMAPIAPPANDKYGNKNLIRSLAINALGGDQASGAFWEDQKSTEAGKRGRELGYTLSEDRKNEDQKRFKENYIAPVNARPGSILRDPITNMPMAFNPHVPDGFTPSFDNRGNVTGMSQIPGALAAIGGVEQAKTMGVGEATPTVTYDASGKSMFSTKATDVRRVNAPNGNPAAGSGLPADNNINASANEIARAQASLKNVTDPASRKLLEDEIANLKTQQQKYNLPTQATISASPTSGISPQQNPGVIANADAAQKASAQTMHDSYSGLQTANASAQAALDSLKKMKELGANKNWMQVGKAATYTTSISKDAAEYEKQRANVTTLLSQQNGTNGTDSGRQLTGESVPDYGKPMPAIADGLTTLENQVIHKQIKGNFLTSHYQAGDSKKYTDMQNQFDQNISPSMVPILSASPGPERNALLEKARKDPSMNKKLEWAVVNGLIK